MRTEVEGLADRLERWAGVIQARDEAVEVMHEAAAALRAQAEQVRVLEGENEQLRLAICGGEDAPGYAASLPLEKILSVAKDNEQTARRDAQLAWDGETATTWKARAEAAERRAGELEGALRKIAFPPKGSSGPSLAGCIEIAARALLPATQAENPQEHDDE